MSALYKILSADCVMHVPTRRAIYLNQAPTIHTEAYLAWVAAGNTADSADPPIPEPPPPPKDLVAEAKAKLADIDLRSIRAIREYIAAQTDAPKVLKDREAEAVQAREYL